MKFLFKKNDASCDARPITFNGLGISECDVKDLNFSSDRASTLRTMHRHTFYEVHIIASGSQSYEIGGERFTVSSGELLLIAPYTPHLVVGETADYRKRAVSFSLEEGSELFSRISHISTHAVAAASQSLLSLLDFLCKENASPSAFSENITELASLECVLLILRLVGATDTGPYRQAPRSDARVAMAKQFIQDNIQSAFTIGALASYCGIGEKQLSRIFFKEEKCTVARYIRMHRLEHIKALLENGRYSMRQISEMMNFSSEYYLNAFFKKHTGMTPGAYRAALRTGGQ